MKNLKSGEATLVEIGAGGFWVLQDPEGKSLMATPPGGGESIIMTFTSEEDCFAFIDQYNIPAGVGPKYIAATQTN